MKPEIVWLIIGVILTLMEFAVPGVILVFFGAGAILTAILTWAGILDSVAFQALFFAASSVTLLVVLRRYLSKYFKGKIDSGKNGQLYDGEFIGKKVRVKNCIIPSTNEGRIEFEGTDWKAVSDHEVEEGQLVEIVSKENITFRVKPVIPDNRD